jgi:hypothetical protein
LPAALFVININPERRGARGLVKGASYGKSIV